MSVERLLGRLMGVRGGRGQWRARRPAHGSKGGTLSIREAPDGRVLVNCFAGCGAIEVLQAVGLDFADLYPERRIADRIPPSELPRAEVADFAGTLHHDALLVSFAARTHAGERVALTDEAVSLMQAIAGRAAYIERRLRGR